jgi:AcrR family transcriptional regulator
MGAPRRVVKPRSIAAVRRLYEHTNVPVEDLAAMLGVTKTTFYKRRKKWGWRLRHDRLPRVEPPREPDEIEPAEEGARASPASPEFGLLLRARQVVEQGLSAVEQIVAQLKATPEHSEDAERAARALAGFMRTLQEIRRLETPAPATPRQDDNDRKPAGNLDDFRRELARKIDGIIGRRNKRIDRDPQPG